MNRRNFLSAAVTTLGASAAGSTILNAQGKVVIDESVTPTLSKPLPFDISLAQWSLRDEIRAGKIDTLSFPLHTKKTYDISAVEYVSGFFKDKAKDKKFLTDLKQRTAAEAITNVLIMVDGEGAMGADTEAERRKTVNQHKQWVEAAQFIGCHTIRVNAHGKGSKEEQAKQSVDGLQKLSTFAADYGINVVVENHGGLSSDSKWLAGVLKSVNMDNCGALPDFGNFAQFDRYTGIKDLMPYAKGISAKCIQFDAQGNCIETDFTKAMQIVLDAGYRGWVGIEWGGGNKNSHRDIIYAKALLENIQLSYVAK